MECGLDSDESLLVPATRSSWGWKKVAGAAASVALVLAGAATVGRSAFASHPSGAASVQDSVGFQAMMSYTPPREQCSKATEDCMATGCCAMSGAKCYKVAGKGKCMKKCPGCETVAPHEVTVAKFPGLSFFCFESYTNNTGSTKKSYELELIKMQKEKGVSIFRCSEQAVYSDVEVMIAPGLYTIKVEDVKGDWHFAKRKLTGAWINTGMFFQIWKKIAAAGAYKRHDWTIKVDADAVFFPNKLYEHLRGAPVPAEGCYYENCKFVDDGYFGNLEVFSTTAFQIFTDNMDSCYTELPWKVGVKNGKFGPMGEDLFAQKCMDKHGVKKVDGFMLTRDGMCEADRPESEKDNKMWQPPCDGATTATIHPLKKPEAWIKCLGEADQFMP